MLTIRDLILPYHSDESMLWYLAAKELGVSGAQIAELKIRRRSLDARKKPELRWVYTVDVTTRKSEKQVLRACRSPKVSLAKDVWYKPPKAKAVPALRPVVVGFGPAGMFAALALALAGLRPIVLERGQDAAKRHEAVREFWETGNLDPECNVQFGEGGAGTFSDGKLNTGTKNERQGWILRQLVRFGADESILWDAKPHVGTDVLLTVVQNLRARVIELGGEVRFGTKLTSLRAEAGRLTGVEIERGGEAEVLPCEQLILAPGHSARDTFRMLEGFGIQMEPKPFSMGVRVEHHQETINRAQYGERIAAASVSAFSARAPVEPCGQCRSAMRGGTSHAFGRLRTGLAMTDTEGGPRTEDVPPADYKLNVRLPDGGSAYTFCMCPGGYVVGAASEPGRVVTNGMSNFAREGENANAALLVTLEPADFPDKSTLGGMVWQQEIEAAAFRAGGSNYFAPAQRVGDFLAHRPTEAWGCVKPTYRPGVTPCELHEVLPERITSVLEGAIPALGKLLTGYDDPDAVMTAPETRSSSPVRILRGETKQSPSLAGLYPCGEGAGYAGGILSAAVDGLLCAEEVIFATAP